MLRGLADRYGFDPMDTPWQEMTPAAQEAFLNADEDVVVDVPANAGRRAGQRTMRWRGVLQIVAGWDLGGMYVDHRSCAACGGNF